jgi:hypothetical protein
MPPASSTNGGGERVQAGAQESVPPITNKPALLDEEVQTAVSAQAGK